MVLCSRLAEVTFRQGRPLATFSPSSLRQPRAAQEPFKPCHNSRLQLHGLFKCRVNCINEEANPHPMAPVISCHGNRYILVDGSYYPSAPVISYHRNLYPAHAPMLQNKPFPVPVQPAGVHRDFALPVGGVKASMPHDIVTGQSAFKVDDLGTKHFVEATPTGNQENRPDMDELPTPSQLAFVLLKLREEVNMLQALFIIVNLSHGHLLDRMADPSVSIARGLYCNEVESIGWRPIGPIGWVFTCVLLYFSQIPSFFNGYHSYSMYSSDLVFTNKLLPFSWTLRNRWSYRLFLATSRILLRLLYSQLNLDLLRITKDVDTGKIEARWRLRGRSRLQIKEK